MLPYCILKHEQLKLFLKGRDTIIPKGQRLSNQVIKIRKEIEQRIISLKLPEFEGVF